MAGCLRFLLRMVLRVDEYDWVVILMYSLLTFVCNRRSCCSAVHVSKFCSKGFFFLKKKEACTDVVFLKLKSYDTEL